MKTRKILTVTPNDEKRTFTLEVVEGFLVKTIETKTFDKMNFFLLKLEGSRYWKKYLRFGAYVVNGAKMHVRNVFGKN